MLIVNQKWRFNDASLFQAHNYLGSIQDDEELVNCTKNLLHGIVEETTNMRNGDNRHGSVDISGDHYFVVPYNSNFWGHWREFAFTLMDHRYLLEYLEEEGKTQPRKFPHDISLMLCDVELAPAVLNLLSSGLHSTHFKSISMINNNIGVHGRDRLHHIHGDSFDTVLEIVRRDTRLESFTFVLNPVINYLNVDRLCDVIRNHPSLRELHLSFSIERGAIGDFRMLSWFINAGRCNLEKLYYRGNHESTKERPAWAISLVPDALATNPVLQTLDLAESQLDDNDALYISRALKHNTNLRFLCLLENPITSIGQVALRTVIFDNTNLSTAAGVNHTCSVRVDDLTGSGSGLHVEINRGEREKNRAKKIYSILAERNSSNSNAQYFDKVPVEFLPDMLGSVQQYSQYHLGPQPLERNENHVEALPIVYEIMRTWDKALAMYETANN